LCAQRQPQHVQTRECSSNSSFGSQPWRLRLVFQTQSRSGLKILALAGFKKRYAGGAADRLKRPAGRRRSSQDNAMEIQFAPPGSKGIGLGEGVFPLPPAKICKRAVLMVVKASCNGAMALRYSSTFSGVIAGLDTILMPSIEQPPCHLQR
jgi:hypothetical protein